MNLCQNPKDNSGSATILSLLISAVILTIAIGFNWLVKEHLKAADALKQKTEAMLTARSTLEALLYSMIAGEVRRGDVVLYRGEEIIGISVMPLNGKTVTAKEGIRISAQDSNGLLSLAYPNAGAIERLVNMLKPGEKKGNIVSDSLQDWIDTDNFSRVNGAEETYYRFQDKPYKPRNHPIQYKEELLMIRGVDESLYKAMSPYITILPTPGFNPNTAPDAVLMSYLDINEAVMKNLKVFIEKRTVRSDSELMQLTGRRIENMDGIFFYPSRFWQITVEYGDPKTIYAIEAGVNVSTGLRHPYNIVYWKE